jgi:hypothetical protein
VVRTARLRRKRGDFFTEIYPWIQEIEDLGTLRQSEKPDNGKPVLEAHGERVNIVVGCTGGLVSLVPFCLFLSGVLRYVFCITGCARDPMTHYSNNSKIRIIELKAISDKRPDI